MWFSAQRRQPSSLWEKAPDHAIALSWLTLTTSNRECIACGRPNRLQLSRKYKFYIHTEPHNPITSMIQSFWALLPQPATPHDGCWSDPSNKLFCECWNVRKRLVEFVEFTMAVGDLNRLHCLLARMLCREGVCLCTKGVGSIYNNICYVTSLQSKFQPFST